MPSINTVAYIAFPVPFSAEFECGICLPLELKIVLTPSIFGPMYLGVVIQLRLRIASIGRDSKSRGLMGLCDLPKSDGAANLLATIFPFFAYRSHQGYEEL